MRLELSPQSAEAVRIERILHSAMDIRSEDDLKESSPDR